MADITSRDFQELIKRQKETTDSLQTIIQQNDRGDDAGERLKDALPEIINDTRLAAQRESFDKKEGITETDNLQQETTDEVIKLQKIQTQGIDETKEQKEEQSELQQQIIEANKKGFLTFGERIKFFALGIKESVTKSNEDKKDEKRDRSKLLTSVQNLGKGILGAITSPIETTFKSIGAILKNLLTGGLLLAALFGLQKFINSPMWPKFLEGLEKTIRATIEMTKTFFKYVGDLYTVFEEEGLIGVAKKLWTDANTKFGSWTKKFLIALGVAITAFGAAIIGVIYAGWKMIKGLGKMLPGMPGSAGAGKTPKTSLKPGDPVRSKSGKVMVAGEDGKPTTKEFKGNKVQKIRKLAGRAGLVGTAIAGGLALLDVKDLMKAKEEGDKEAESIAKQSLTSTGGALGGAAIGAAVGSFVPIIGTGIGAIVGGIIGSFGGDLAGDTLFKTNTQTNKEISEKNHKLQLEAEARTKKLDLMLEKGTITNEEHLKRSNEISKEAAEQMKENNKGLILETQKNSLKQEKKSNEIIALMEENNKLLADKQNQAASFMMAGGNTNITTNPSEQTIVMDTKITDSFHTQVYRQSFG
tara:strand:- start:266 stop:2020 length:1755 start_codon:yes stop_codon:yes gene_type:complete